MIPTTLRVTQIAFLLVLGCILPAKAQSTLESADFSNPLFGTRFVEDEGRIWFSAVNFVEGGELWITDGTFDVLGRRVLVEHLPPTSHRISHRFSLAHVAAGVYFIHIQVGNQEEVHKVIRK